MRAREGLRSACCGLATAAAVLLGCGKSSSGLSELAHAGRVEQVGEFKLDEKTLARHIRYETGVGDDQIAPLARARMAEDLFAEALLARAAEREGLAFPAEAASREVDRLRGLLGAGAPEGALQDDARRRLLARLYETRVLARQVVVREQTVAEELRRQEGAPGEEQIVFRQLRVLNLQEAEKAYQEVISGEPFERLAHEASSAPDKGQPLSRSPSELPQPAADALRALSEGGTSRPVNLDGAYYLFQLVARNSGAGPGRVRNQEDIRRQLESRVFEDLRRSTLVELARAEGVRAPVADRPEEDATR